MIEEFTWFAKQAATNRNDIGLIWCLALLSKRDEKYVDSVLNFVIP